MENEKDEGNVTREQERIAEEPEQRGLASPLKFNMDVNMGINLSILLTLVIFCGLLFLPAKMLLDTSYVIANESEPRQIPNNANKTNFLSSMKFRERKMCPGLNYAYWLSSIFYSNYDRNCTYAVKRDTIKGQEKRKIKESKEMEKLICASESKKETAVIVNSYNGTFEEMRTTGKPKSVPVTGHILAMMLVVSAIAAFVEVLRIRFINPKVPIYRHSYDREESTRMGKIIMAVEGITI